jgi:sugar lactone lactonase YvrE
MRTNHKFTAIFSVALLSILLLTASTQSVKAATNQVSILSGQGGAGEFSNPSGVSVAPDGTVYVADRENFEIKRVVSGKVSAFARTAPTADGNVLNSFCGVHAKNPDEIWASNCENSKVFRFNSAGALIRTYVLALPFKSVCVGCIDWSAGIVVDDFGGIFLTDEFNDVILRIDQATGQTSVWAGQPGIKGSQNGDAKSSTFNLPRGIAIDSRGNLLVADQSNGSIRRITPQGVVSTVQSGLPRPVGVAIDSNDSIYVTSDIWDGSIITKVGQGRIYDDSSATINYGVNGTVVGQLTFATNGGLAIDSRGTNPSNNIYVTDLLNHSIKIFSASGKLIGRFGSEDSYGVSAPGTSKQFYMHPNHTFPLADGTYLVLDNFTIKHIGPTGVILKVTRLERGCWYANGAAFTPDGTFFCAQGNTIEVRFTNGTWTTIGNATAGKADGNSSSARFRLPEGMAVFKGSVYVADIGNKQIRKVTRIAGTSDFQVTTVLGTGTWDGGGDVMARSKANFASPTRIAIDGNGNLYIADGGVDSIYKTSVVQDSDVTRVGRYIGSWPSSMVADGDGIVYVSGWGGKIHKVENNKMTYFAGSGVGNKLGTADTSVFNRPTGLSIDPKGQLIIADRDSQLIKKISIDAEPNFYTATPVSAYSAYLSAAPVQTPVLTSESDQTLSARLIATNQTGLIARTYQAPNTDVPARDVKGLNLCEVSIEKKFDLNWGYSPISYGSGCNSKRFLVNYKGFITMPDAGRSSARRMYISAAGGAYLKIGENFIIDKWREEGGIASWPYDANKVFDFVGGKQYPIDIWYFKDQNSSSTSSATLKLRWSTLPGNNGTTSFIDEKYFAPAKSESANIVAPVSPSGPSVSINLNFINLKVKVPDNATSVVLYAPEFGVTKAKPLIGKIKAGLATFEVAVSSKFAGKKGVLQLVTGNAVGESTPLKVPVTVPKVVTKPVPKVKPILKPQVQQTVSCEKGGIKRSFEGTSCPPGYTRG